VQLERGNDTAAWEVGGSEWPWCGMMTWLVGAHSWNRTPEDGEQGVVY